MGKRKMNGCVWGFQQQKSAKKLDDYATNNYAAAKPSGC